MSKLNRALAWNPLGSAAGMDVLWFDALKVVAQSPRPLWNRHLVTNCFHHFHSFSYSICFHPDPRPDSWVNDLAYPSWMWKPWGICSLLSFRGRLSSKPTVQHTTTITIYNLQLMNSSSMFFTPLRYECPQRIAPSSRTRVWSFAQSGTPCETTWDRLTWSDGESFGIDLNILKCNIWIPFYIDLCIHVVDLRHFSARCYEVLAELFLDGRGMHYDGTCDMTWQLGPTRPGD